MARWIVLVVALCVPSVSSQVATGRLNGIATDASGGAIPGVTVRLTQGAAVRETVTTREGTYEFLDLAAGIYHVEARLSGFRAVRADITVTQGTTTFDPVMRVGMLSNPHFVRLPFAQVVRRAARVAHVRVKIPVREAVQCSTAATLWSADVLGDASPRLTDTAGVLQFWQLDAGTVDEDGRRVRGSQAPLTAGGEFVMVLQATTDPECQLHADRFYTVPVVNGITQWPYEERDGLLSTMPVARFLAAVSVLRRQP